MLYVKAKFNEEIEIKVPLYGDEIFSNCPVCGLETKVDEELLADILVNEGDLSGTTVYCKPCGDEWRNNNTKPE